MFLIAGSLSAASCGSASPSDSNLREQRIEQLHQIAQLCGVPENALTLSADGQTQFRPAPDTTYVAVSCTFGELEKGGFPPEKIGFVSEPPPETR